MTIEEKRKALSLYVFCRNRVIILMERKKMYQDEIYSVKASNINGMPGAHEPHGVDDMVIKCINQTEDIDKQIIRLTKTMKRIKKVIEAVENYKYRSILEMRFIDGMSNNEIRYALGKSNGTAPIGLTTLQQHMHNALKSVPISETLFEDCD